MKTKKYLSYEKLCIIALIVSIFFKLAYAVRVPYNVSPHDLNLTSDWTNIPDGHLGYIQYMYQYKHLTDFSPAEYRSQYYHPPLFYILSAFIMGMFDPMKNNNLSSAFEAIQLFNMLIAAMIPVVAFRTFKALELKEAGLFWATCLISFSPALYPIGAALNSDCLMTFFLSLVILNAVRWAKKQDMITIAKIGLFLALAMLSKTSGVLVAPALAVLFLWILIEKKEQFKKLLPQYIVFGLISIPLGLSWVLREYMLFGVPFNYVLEQSVDSFQYIGDCSLLQRIGIPSYYEITEVKILWGYRQSYSNIWGQTLLTMALDEGILAVPNHLAYYLLILLYWGNSVLFMCSFVTFLVSLFIKNVPAKIRVFFLTGFSTHLASYILFAFQQPFICTMNFRYIATILIFLFASVGMIGTHKKPKAKWAESFISCVIVFASLYTSVLYIIYAK